MSKFNKPISQLFNESSDKIDIYRVEHIKTKKGPYQTKLNDGSSFHLSDTFPTDPKYNPDPLRDSSWKDAINNHEYVKKDLSWWMRNGVFGFSSIPQMKRWFTSKALKWMIDDIGEFQIVKKSIPSEFVACGEYQCIVLNSGWDKVKSKTIKL